MRCCGKLLKNFNDLKPRSCRCPVECPAKDRLKIVDAKGKVLTSCLHNKERVTTLLLERKLGKGCEAIKPSLVLRH